MISNTIHINVECSCVKCAKKRAQVKIYASRGKLTRLIEAEIRAMAGTKKSLNQICNTFAGKVEQFYVESL